MTDTCRRGFDEAMLSGYLDRALTQGDEQRVRVHLEECGACRAELEEMKRLREITMTTRFETPTDEQWDERPRGSGSRWSLRLGWGIFLVWAAGIVGFVLWQMAAGPESLWEKLIFFGGLSGAGLLLLSVLLDRLKNLETDRYREVEK